MSVPFSRRKLSELRRISIFRVAIFFALVSAALLSQLVLVARECSPSRSFLAAPPTPSRLPHTHRLAPSHQCAKNSRSVEYAAASKEPRVSLVDQRQFAAGGYNLIAKGSGEINACGPIISLLSKMQHNFRIYGTLAEFGVHHGRFTGFLFITARTTEKLVAGDLFSQQNKNVDKSGRGDARKFLQGTQTYGVNASQIYALIEASTDELPFDLSSKAKFEPFRIVSVDASHTAAFTFNDLQLAFCNLLRGGIVILDDWFHSSWPGVVEGFFQFIEHGGIDDVYPFLVCESKLFLTNDKAMYEFYYNSLRDHVGLQTFVKQYAVEKERGNVEYEMMGMKYLKCSSRSELMVDKIQELWASEVY